MTWLRITEQATAATIDSESVRLVVRSDETTLRIAEGISRAYLLASLAEYATVDHDHDGDYDTAGSAAAAQAAAQTYAAGLVDDLSGVSDAVTARGNLGLGTAAVEDADAFEPGLGNPGTDGYVLSSTAAGVRSWIELMSGGGVEFPWQPDSDGAHSILQNAAGTSDLYRVNTNTNQAAAHVFRSGNVTFEVLDTSQNTTFRGGSPALKLRNAHPTASGTGGIDFWVYAQNQGSKIVMTGYPAVYSEIATGTDRFWFATLASELYIGAGSGAGRQFWLKESTQAMELVNVDMVLPTTRGIKPKSNVTGWPLVQDASGNAIITIDTVSKLVKLIGCPTSDPAVAGAVWSDGGTLKISAG